MKLNALNFQTKLGLSGFLITVMLGILSAATLIGLIYSENDSGFNIPNIEKVKAKYSDPVLVGAMKTSMYEYVTLDEDIDIVAQWVADGAQDDAFFTDEVMYILENDCQKCHSRGSEMSDAIPSIPFSNYEDVIEHVDKGYSWTHMAKSAHYHLLGMSVFVVVVSLAMSFSSYLSWIKTTVISAAWIGLWLDVSSWWFAKFWDVFAYVISGAGAVEIGSVVLMAVLCLYDMWFKVPDALSE